MKKVEIFFIAFYLFNNQYHITVGISFSIVLQ